MKRSSVGFVIALASLLAACGGDDKDTGTKKDPQEKAGSGADDKGTKSCGATKCKLPEGVTGDLCCKDQFAGICGVMAGGNCRELPKTDDRCPPPQLNVRFPMPPGSTGGGMTVFGCCTSNDECGIDFGAGCQPRTTACGVIGPDQVDKIKPQTCDGDPLPLPANCGMSMISIPGVAGSGGS